MHNIAADGESTGEGAGWHNAAGDRDGLAVAASVVRKLALERGLFGDARAAVSANAAELYRRLERTTQGFFRDAAVIHVAALCATVEEDRLRPAIDNAIEQAVRWRGLGSRCCAVSAVGCIHEPRRWIGWNFPQDVVFHGDNVTAFLSVGGS